MKAIRLARCTSRVPPVVKEVAVINEITAEDIQATNSKTVAEALAFAPGMRVTTGTKNEPGISLHGVFEKLALRVLKQQGHRSQQLSGPGP